MGQRARESRRRRRGVAGATRSPAALEAASREQRRKRDASVIGQRVYHASIELMQEGAPDPLPVHVLAPLMVAAENIAPGACKLAGLDVTEENAREVAAYLISGFREMAVMLDLKHFEAWQGRSNEAGASDDPSAT